MSEQILKMWDKFWRDKNGHGKVVIASWPNIPIIIWAFFTLLSLLFSSKSKIADVSQWLGVIALVIWSLLEIFRGVNYFRRTLGLVVLVFSIINIIHLL